MAGIKLSKLPDRTPIKVSIILLPVLYRDLRRYPDLYRAQFGQAEPVTELLPSMLADFFGSDRSFSKARKDGGMDTATQLPAESALRCGGFATPILNFPDNDAV